MLTLKVIHIDADGGRTTHLFSGERLSHVETEETTHYELTSDEQYFFVVGKLPNSSATQPYIMSKVTIFDGNDTQTIFILPKSDCFVMSNGKTVDTFASYYKLIDNE